MKFIFKVVIIFGLLSACAKPVKVAVTPGSIPSIPAKVAIAPVQVIGTATVTLPSGQKTIAVRLSNPAAKGIEDYVKGDGVFSEVMAIKEDAIPTAPGIPEVVQAGRDVGADVVLLGKIVEFIGQHEYGFRPSLKEHIVFELSAWETATGSRLWFKKEGLDLERHEKISEWSEEKIEDRYVSIATEDILPIVLQ